MYGNEITRLSDGKYSTACILTNEILNQNIVDNYTTFRVRSYMYYGGGTRTSSAYNSGYFYIDGTWVHDGNYTLTKDARYVLMGYKDITVYHNNDGSFPGRAVDFNAYSYHFDPAVSGTGYLSAPNIARKANVINATDFNDEGNPTITYTNPGGFRINARLEFSGAIIRRDNIANTGSYTFDLTEEERKLLKQKCTGNSMTVREVIATCISGETESLWSWQDKTMTLINANPEFNNFEFQDINDKTIALTGNNKNIIKGYSNVQVTIPVLDKAIPKKEAIMKNYRFTCGDKNNKEPMLFSEMEDVIGVIDGVPNGTFTVFATDNRGNVGKVEKLANEAIDYSPLTKISIDTYRNNGVSEQVVLKLEGTINIVDFGNKVNSIKSAIVRHKVARTNEWTHKQEITLEVNDGRFSYEGLIIGDLESKGFNISNSYDVEVVVSDELSSVTFTDTFSSGTPNLAYHKNGMGVMKKYDTNIGGALQIGGSVDIDGEITVQGSSSPIYVGVKGDKGEPGPTGPTGPQGNPGTDLKVLGVYETLEQLKQEHPTGEKGDVYLVDGFIYVWDISKSDWSKGGNIANVFGDTLPVGTITKYGGENIPNNWLLCDGSQYLKTDYPELYNAIGNHYNLDSDEGELYFRVPDFRERVGVGSNGDGEFGLGNTGGEKEHKLTANEIPDLPVKFTNSNSVVLTKDGTVQTNLTSGYSRGAGKWDSGTDGELYADGGGQAHNNMPPYVVVNYIIKVKQSAGIVADVLNTKNDSETDSYSCDYINKMQKYTEEEQVIGSWKDGKPIYRKVLEGTTNASTSATLGSIPNLDTLIDVRGVTGGTYKGGMTWINLGVSPQQYRQVYVTGTTVGMVKQDSDATPYRIILEYTKTTD